MKKKGLLIIVAIIMLSIAGCSNTAVNWKTSLVDGFNNWLQSFSKYALTKDFELQGIREYGMDAYTGSYEATYEDWTGKELIFGGTSLERENGNQLKATYRLTVTNGTARFYWITAGQEYTIAESDAENIFEFTLGSGDNYLVLEGNHLSGTLSLNVE